MRQLAFIILTAAAIFLPLSSIAFAENNSRKEVAFGQAPRLELLDSNNKSFSSAMLKNKVWVANFFFSRCTGPCPIQAAHLKLVQNDFKDRNDFKIVSITADPNFDTPEILNSYAKKHGADPENWFFLTGEYEQTVELLNEGFKLGSGSEPIYHSSRFVLVDKEGMIRGYYRGTELSEVKKLISVSKKLLTADD